MRTTSPLSPASVAIDVPGHRAGTAAYRRMLLGLGAAGIATFAQLYAPQGLLPSLARGLAVDASRAALAVSLATLGVALAVVPWSVLSDRIGRLRAMRIAISTAAVGGLLVALSPTADALLVLRFIEGLALGGLPALAMTYLHDEVDPRHTAAAAAAYISGTTLGGACGRLVAGPLADLVGWRLALASVATLCLVAAAAFLRLMPPARRHAPARPSIAQVVANVRRSLSDPLLLALYLQPMLIMGGFVAVYNYLGFRLESPAFGLPAVTASLIFAAYGAGTVSSRLVGRWVPRYGRLPVLTAGTAAMIIGVLLTLSSSLIMVVSGLLVLTAGTFMAHATASAWVGHRAGTGRAQATALYNVALYTGSAMFGWLVGLAWVRSGWPATAGTVAGLAALALVAGLIGDWADRRGGRSARGQIGEGADRRRS
ncbi:MAG TPA: MFS transporter [Microlunatus sp.]|nr:MFS transporter [Microlunatus sp.]